MDRIWLDHYPDAVPADIDLQEYTSLADLFRRCCGRYAYSPAVTSFGHTLSYAEIDVAARRLATYLTHELGLRQGERVALLLPNIPQHPIAFYALMRAGLVAVNCDPSLPRAVLAYQLRDSGCRCVIAVEDSARKLSRSLKNTRVESVLLTKIADMLPVHRRTTQNFSHKWLKGRVPRYRLPGVVPFRQAVAETAHDYADPIVPISDLAVLQYTKGTTRTPKAVMLSHQNLLAAVQQVSSWYAGVLIPGAETIACGISLTQGSGLLHNLLLPVRLGAHSLLISEVRNRKALVEELQTLEFTALTGVGSMYRALLNTPGFDEIHFNSIKVAIACGMTLHRTVASDWAKATSVPLISAYGLVETGFALSSTPPDMPTFTDGSGLPLPSTEISIRDREGRELGADKPGELWVKGPQVMMGYWHKDKPLHKPNATDWLRSGDVAMMSKRGYIQLLERLRDVIHVDGNAIFPSQIEAQLRMHPGIREAALVAVPDGRGGRSNNRMALFVALKDKSLHDFEIMTYCEQLLEPTQRPQNVYILNRLPRDTDGRLLRRELRKPIVWDRRVA